jgi:hypothetical protein
MDRRTRPCIAPDCLGECPCPALAPAREEKMVQRRGGARCLVPRARVTMLGSSVKMGSRTPPRSPARNPSEGYESAFEAAALAFGVRHLSISS